ncbi:acetolactate synthase large subunit [Algoriphagus antarcticus]|uniref:Acetolactate synthase-1/2/3 large subunit n=1 Tax=Algoriphagus antarcticus TaxID=238540 RepID=A0A3E0DCF4_9BACT|nr:acetolactate synthase large subunit [Algoriphagus antarcticus]REG79571.1 acetolactate synthase-1/2/3 large subunit [Algoriphagus antarcticus]
MKASDLFIKALENEGVKYIFAVPGEENLDMIQSIKESSIRLIVTRHEQGAGFMAATYGRLSGHPGVCLSTLGPGATNLVTPAAFAQLGGMPMVMITGQKPIKENKQAKFQIINVVDMMRPLTKYTKQIVNSENIASQIREAFRLAIEEKPGAVHLEFPEDIAQEECNFKVFEPIGHLIPKVDPRAIDEAVKMITAAKKPLLLIGAGANRKETCDSLRNFANRTGIYFLTTQMGKGVIDERAPNYLGTAALSSGDFIHAAIDKADLIINVGHDVIEKPPFFMKSGGKIVIHINFSPAEIDPVYFPQLNVVGEITDSINQLSQALQVQEHWDFSFFQKVKQEALSSSENYSKDVRFPILPQRLVYLLRKILSSEDIITLDNGIYKLWFARNYICHQPNTLLLDNALATMGAGLSAAIMAKILNPSKNVVAVCGDGGFMMNSQELETAIRLQLNLTVIVLNDNAFGMIKWKQKDMGFDDFGLDYGNPDFVKYAKSYGAGGFRPETDEEFQEVFSKCLISQGVNLIELRVDYSLNHQLLNIMFKEQSSKLINEG